LIKEYWFGDNIGLSNRIESFYDEYDRIKKELQNKLYLKDL
jgi:hypothetical protein